MLRTLGTFVCRRCALRMPTSVSRLMAWSAVTVDRPMVAAAVVTVKDWSGG